MKRTALAVIAAAAALVLAACSTDAGGGSTGTEPAEGSKVLGVVAYIGNNAINQQAIRGATQVAEDAGWEVKVTDDVAATPWADRSTYHASASPQPELFTEQRLINLVGDPIAVE